MLTKIAHLHESGEDYLEAVLILSKTKGSVRRVDLADYFGYTKPSITVAINSLIGEGLLEADKEGLLHLTESGTEIADKIYEQHCFFRQMLINAGIDPAMADKEACKLEHCLSQESFDKLCMAYGQEHNTSDSGTLVLAKAPQKEDEF